LPRGAGDFRVVALGVGLFQLFEKVFRESR